MALHSKAQSAFILLGAIREIEVRIEITGPRYRGDELLHAVELGFYPIASPNATVSKSLRDEYNSLFIRGYGLEDCTSSHDFIVAETKSAASFCTKCPTPGTVTSVRSLSSHSHV